MEEKNKLVVKIASREYTIISAEDSEYMYQIASLVNKEMRLIMASNPRISVDMASVLVSLNAKDKEQKTAKENQKLIEKLKLYDHSTEALMAKNKELEVLLSEKDEQSSENMTDELSAELAAVKGSLQKAEAALTREEEKVGLLESDLQTAKQLLEEKEEALKKALEEINQKERDLEELLN